MAIGRQEAKSGDNARMVITARAAAHAADVRPTIKELQASGVTTLRAIAAVLNERNIPTASRHGQWHPAQVRRVLARAHDLRGRTW
jgi:hypothetical protein